MLVFQCYDISRQAVRSIATPDIVPRHISSLQLPRTDSVCALISVDFFSVQPFFCTQNFGSEVQKILMNIPTRAGLHGHGLLDSIERSEYPT
jgi:hypothetical protein